MQEKEYNLNGYWINGNLEDFNVEEFIEKVKARKEALHTNRVVKDTADYKEFYTILVHPVGKVENPRSIYVDIVLTSFYNNKEDQSRVAVVDFDSYEEAIKYIEDFKLKTLNELITKEEKPNPQIETNHPALDKLISELNSQTEFDNELIDSEFNFMLQEDNGHLYLFDANENYDIYYEETLNYLLQDTAAEFGFDYKPVKDDIMPRIEAAVKEDFGPDAYIEWETQVRMLIVREY